MDPEHENERPIDRKTARWLLAGGALAGLVAAAAPFLRRLKAAGDVDTRTPGVEPGFAGHVYAENLEDVLNAAVRAAERLGWRVVEEDRVDRSMRAEVIVPPHFVDDVRVYLEPEDDGTLVNVRAHSRVQRMDLGLLARHVRTLLAEMDALLTRVR